LYIIYFIIL